MARPTTRGSGFTLIEVLVVMVIIGILASIAQPRVISAVINAREAVLKQDLYVLRDAIDQYYADKGVYPPALDALVEQKYLRRIPVDPMTGSRETWVLVFSDEEVEAEVERGIYDVKSGSEKIALDGSRYADW